MSSAIDQTTSQTASAEPGLPALAVSSLKLAKTTASKQAQLSAESLANRLERYHQIKALEAQGLSNRQIALQLGLDRNSVNRYIAAVDAEEVISTKFVQGRSKLSEAHKIYLYQRFSQEQPTVAQLHQELQERGYHGSIVPVRTFLARLRPQPYWRGQHTKSPRTRQMVQLPPLPSTSKLSSSQASWLVFKLERGDQRLSDEQQRLLKIICEKDQQVELVYQLAQQFRALVKNKRAGELEEWLSQAKASKVKELLSFCKGIERDRAAVEAGIGLDYSNGQLDGQIHRAKNIKRQMYNRARFKLLRTRILAAA
jgi:transposase